MPERDFGSEGAGLSSPVDQFDSKMKLQVLLCEYTAVRNVAVNRTNNIFQTTAVLAVLTSWATSRPAYDRLFVCVTVGALAVLAICIWCIARDMYWAGRRVRELESEVNRLASEPLMVWKSYYGGLRRYVPLSEPRRRPSTDKSTERSRGAGV